MSLVSYLVRRTFKKGDLKRDAGLTIPGDVTVSEGIPYGPDPVWQSLEICRPTGSAGTALPVRMGGKWEIARGRRVRTRRPRADFYDRSPGRRPRFSPSPLTREASR